MSEKNDKEPYLNFDEYIRQGDSQKKERAEAWRVAIGLQAVDGSCFPHDFVTKKSFRCK
jgi:hypothetical protein